MFYVFLCLPLNEGTYPQSTRAVYIVSGLYRLLPAMLFYVVSVIPDLDVGYSNSGFLYQPCNMTLYEGENAKLNCTPTQRSGLIATWIINGKRHYWTDFMATPAFSFDLYDNSLTINNASLDLDGSSFQCVIDRRPSRIAYLTVLYNPLDTSTFTLQLQQTIVAAPGGNLAQLDNNKHNFIITPVNSNYII